MEGRARRRRGGAPGRGARPRPRRCRRPRARCGRRRCRRAAGSPGRCRRGPPRSASAPRSTDCGRGGRANRGGRRRRRRRRRARPARPRPPGPASAPSRRGGALRRRRERRPRAGRRRRRRSGRRCSTATSCGCASPVHRAAGGELPGGEPAVDPDRAAVLGGDVDAAPVRGERDRRRRLEPAPVRARLGVSRDALDLAQPSGAAVAREDAERAERADAAADDDRAAVRRHRDARRPRDRDAVGAAARSRDALHGTERRGGGRGRRRERGAAGEDEQAHAQIIPAAYWADVSESDGKLECRCAESALRRRRRLHGHAARGEPARRLHRRA